MLSEHARRPLHRIQVGLTRSALVFLTEPRSAVVGGHVLQAFVSQGSWDGGSAIPFPWRGVSYSRGAAGPHDSASCERRARGRCAVL